MCDEKWGRGKSRDGKRFMIRPEVIALLCSIAMRTWKIIRVNV